MKVVLATGIYPPDIGGPATYVEALARSLHARGHKVIVVTYHSLFPTHHHSDWKVIHVRKGHGVLGRWFRYATILKHVAADADAVIVFSSVSCGIPLILSGLKGPKKFLRLGGDFFWERYTALGGRLGLRAWYHSSKLRLTCLLNTAFMEPILASFSHVVYSTNFQMKLHESVYPALTAHSVIENALPAGTPRWHELHRPFKLLSLGRFVSFKNLLALLHALPLLPDVTLTMVGEGPRRQLIERMIERLKLSDRVTLKRIVLGDDKRALLDDHDLLVIPSITEISPNTALEARSAGLPVLLTAETGLSERLTHGMLLADLNTPEAIARAIKQAQADYPALAARAAEPIADRNWERVTDDWLKLLV